jgi:hypothetical protein
MIASRSSVGGETEESWGFEVIPAEGGVAALGLLLKSSTAQATVLA